MASERQFRIVRNAWGERVEGEVIGELVMRREWKDRDCPHLNRWVLSDGDGDGPTHGTKHRKALRMIAEVLAERPNTAGDLPAADAMIMRLGLGDDTLSDSDAEWGVREWAVEWRRRRGG